MMTEKSLPFNVLLGGLVAALSHCSPLHVLFFVVQVFTPSNSMLVIYWPPTEWRWGKRTNCLISTAIHEGSFLIERGTMAPARSPRTLRFERFGTEHLLQWQSANWRICRRRTCSFEEQEHPKGHRYQPR